MPEPATPRDAAAPLLHGTVLRVNHRRARRLVRDLLRAAATGSPEEGATLARLRARHVDALALLQAAIVRDDDAIAAIASAAGASADALGVVGQLAVMPLLRACAARLHDRVSADWSRGYCPICAAWPLLVELRGLERARRLRCGRCGDDWSIPVLRCAYCGEDEHDRLGALLPDGEEQRRRVETCATCKGYLKSLSTLRALDARALALEDAMSVDLDLAAQERGFGRPVEPAWTLELRLERAPRMPGALARWL